MPRNSPKISIRFFDDKEVRAIWDDDHAKWWFSVLDIVGVLNQEEDYTKTRNYWKYLKAKLRKENIEVVSATTQFKMVAPDGKKRMTDVLDSEDSSGLNLSAACPKTQEYLHV
jgi:cell filamentation protein